MQSARIYIMRHGQVANHHEMRYNGHHDVDITDLGVLQMRRLAVFFSNIPVKAVYSSDLMRAAKGAEILSSSLGLGFTKINALRELHLGRWEGLTRGEAVARFPEDEGFSFRDLGTGKVEGGESLPDLSARVMPAVRDIVQRHRNETACIVAHGGVNRVILSDAMGLPLENFFRIEQDYGCVNAIDYFADGVKVVKLLNGGPNQEMQATRLY